MGAPPGRRTNAIDFTTRGVSKGGAGVVSELQEFKSEWRVELSGCGGVGGVGGGGDGGGGGSGGGTVAAAAGESNLVAISRDPWKELRREIAMSHRARVGLAARTALLLVLCVALVLFVPRDPAGRASLHQFPPKFPPELPGLFSPGPPTPRDDGAL